MKKGLVIVIVAGIVLIAAGVILWFFFRPSEGNAPAPDVGGDPFGEGSGDRDIPPPPQGVGGEGGDGGVDAFVPSLRRLSGEPVAAVAFSADGALRFIERGTGHIYETQPDDPAVTRISNTTIPKVQEAFWSDDGNHLLIRYLRDDGETVATFKATLDASARPADGSGGAESGLTGVFLPDGIASAATGGNGQFLYVEPDETGSSIVRGSFTADASREIHHSSFRSWVLSWGDSANAFMTTKASSKAVGYAYTLNTVSGSFKKFFGGIHGLTALPNSNASKALYSRSDGNGFATLIFTAEEGVVEDSPLATLPEKCVWSKLDMNVLYCGIPKTTPSGAYPDEWYQGAVSFSDDLWLIDTNDLTTELVLDTDGTSITSLDAVSLALNKDETHLTFKNKIDGSAWLLKLNN